MFVPRQHCSDNELVKWLVFLTLTGIFVLVVTRPTSGEALRTDRMRINTEKAAEIVVPPSLLGKESRRGSVAPTARRIWDILELHDSGRFEEAISQWGDLWLQDRGKAWRAVAVATAHLRMGHLDDAEFVLRTACDRKLDNAVTHYVRGVVFFTKADVAYSEGQAYVAEQLREDARIEFEKAVATASQVDLTEPLGLRGTKLVARVQRFDTVFPEVLVPLRTPTVEDLLSVLNVDDTVGKAHIALAQISFEARQLAAAEAHLDAAAEGGTPVAELYLTLGEAYEANGQHRDAARSFIKSMKDNQGMAGSAAKAIGNLRRSFR